MSLPMWDNAINASIRYTSPNDWYRNLHQAFIDEQWENTTALKTNIGEQQVTNPPDLFQDFEFNTVEAWVNTIVGQSSSGQKTGRDFLQLIFQDITHPKYEGRYYIVDNEYYISYFDNRVVDVDANLSVRRCNEWMKIIDPMSGSIYQIPCVVDYDMSAPSLRVTTAIITPNNHAVVKVQQNAMTDRLFVTNARFILGNRPFKLTGMQNATNQFINNNISSLMELDLFLDEIWDNDNLIDGVADNGTYDYVLDINGNNLELAQGSEGDLFANITLNGQEVQRVVNWHSSNPEIVTVDDMGHYHVIGEVGGSVVITAQLYNNPDVRDNITITIVDTSNLTLEVYINPMIDSIRETETKALTVLGIYNGETIVPDNVIVSLDSNMVQYLTYQIENNIVYLTCLKRKAETVSVGFEIKSIDLDLTATKTIDIKLTNLLG